MSQPPAPPMTRDSILLIGGAGFLGSALRRTIAARGLRAIVVGRSPGVAVGEGERYFVTAAPGQLAVNLADERVSTVIDLSYAGVPNDGPDAAADILACNLAAQSANIALARALGAPRFVFTSSGGAVYGDGGEGPLTEAAPAHPRSPYGAAKLALEQQLLSAPNLDAVIVRPSNVYGPGQLPFRGEGLVATAMANALLGQPQPVFGDGSAVRDYLFIDDFCDALLGVAALSVSGGIYNIGAGEGTSTAALLDRIGAITARDGFPLAIEWQDARPSDVARNTLDCNRLHALTGWAPQTALDNGLAASWAWIRTQ
jgi:UDP-glucose 4-epimerase